MQTDFTQESAEQERWHLRPGAQRFAGFFRRLVSNEFLPPDALKAASGQRLQRVMLHIARNVPWYEDMAKRTGIDLTSIDSPDDLSALPVLSKVELAQAGPALVARALPPGEKLYGWFSSSGTTGRPARVLHTKLSNMMFNLLVQRGHRWFRFDPKGTMASIRITSQNPSQPDGTPLPMGAALRAPAWRYSGNFYATGPHFHFNIENPVEVQIDWLKRICPDYLQTYSESLEHLAFACDGAWPVPGIRKLNAISEQLTSSMRRRIESTLGAPIVQGYGLNEIGLVALRCDAGRYHWHVEHCIVEIVDAAGSPCLPGQRGRVVVTALRNMAMPLLRYDTGDIAEAVAGPCPCGRTLPAFGEISGRYSRIAYLPEHTLARVARIRVALEEMPAEVVRSLRQFQIHQYRGGRLELRILSTEPMSPEFHRRVIEQWRQEPSHADGVLDIVQVDCIARSPGGKFQDFTSDYMPAPDENREPG
ncbi:MAG: hypothetical protein OEL20_00945 [Sulfuritalea sp.]|nr:hypothetical protein [Sulfuritalea sp.]